MKKALIFGAGNIGRGFLGLELYNSGYSISFTDVDKDILENIRANAGYRVEIIETGVSKFVPVENVFHSSEDLSSVIQDASLIVMAVGPKHLDKVAKTLAPKLKSYDKQEYKNIVACENMVNGSSKVKEFINAEVGELSDFIGFPDAVVDRISLPGNPVRVESFFEWVVDRKGWKGNPDIACIKYVDNLEAYLKRKLYLLNGIHVTIGAMGQFKGIQYIHEALEDTEIADTIKGQIREVSAVLQQKYGFTDQEQADYVSAIITRFKNSKLMDETKRVVRDPIRKLGREERLVGPALLCSDIKYLSRSIAYLMYWSDANDKESVELEKKIIKDGVGDTLASIAQLDKDEHRKLIKMVEDYFVQMQK